MDFSKGTPCQFFFWIAAIFALFWRATPPKKGEERYFSSGNPCQLHRGGGYVETRRGGSTNSDFLIPKFEIHYLILHILILTLYGLV